MRLRTVARGLIAGTQLESPIKRLHYALTRTKNSLYDVQTIEIMRRVLGPTSVGVDVGAFEGSMLKHMVRFAPKARHYAFEPISRLSERLQQQFPTCSVRNVALGAAPGAETYREIVETPALSGLRRRIDLPPEIATREYSVAVETLDRSIPESVKVELIKIDVEGGELGVLRGGADTIRRCRPVIVFECGLGGADSYGTKPAEIFSFVAAELGLCVYLLGSWLEAGPPLTSAEFVRQFEQSLNYYFAAAPGGPATSA